MSDSTRTDQLCVLWLLGEWRCELEQPDRLRLYRGAALVAEHVTKRRDHVQQYADIWRAAIADTFAFAPEMSELEDSDDPALARIWTDADGRIWQMNEPATRLFNIINPNRRLITIFFGDNRDRLAVLLGEAANGHVGSVDRVILRPRERRPIPVRIRLNREEDSAFVLWTIVPHLD